MKRTGIRIGSFFLSVVLLLGLLTVTASADWGDDAISYAVNNGFAPDNDQGSFARSAPLTRGMFITMLGRLAGVDPAAQPASVYSDVAETDSIAPYVMWARVAGVMDGINESEFAPQNTLNREELATVVARYLQLNGVKEKRFNLNKYVDADAIHEWARDGVAYCSSRKILAGDLGRFKPLEIVSCAMGAAVIQRLHTMDTSGTPTVLYLLAILLVVALILAFTLYQKKRHTPPPKRLDTRPQKR